MMKRLSKIALLAAASAFMLAVFPACDGEESDPEPSVKITGGNSVTVGGTPLELTAVVSDFPEGVTYEWSSLTTDKATVEQKSDDPSKATVTAVAEGKATITVTATAGETVKTATVDVTVKAEGEPDSTPDDPKGATATFTFLSGDYINSSTEPAKDGFFNGTKDDGTLDVTVSAVELQLYKSGTGWTAIDASASSTKQAGSTNANMGGGADAPASVQGQFATKNDAVANASAEVFGENGYEMGRIKLSVTTGANAVALKKISGYFGSGKTFLKGYVKVGDNKYAEITGTTALGSKGFSVKDFAVNQTIPASSTKDVYILLGKTATSAPSAGTTIDVAKLVYEFAAAEN